MSLTVAITGLHAGENPQPGVGVLKSLRRNYTDLFAIGLVYDALESGVYSSDGPDEVYEFPYPSSGMDAVLARLDYIQSHHPIDILIPTLDAEILPLIAAAPELHKRGIRALLPTAESFKARSKTKLNALAEECGCLTPRSIPARNLGEAIEAAAQVGYPCMVKGQFYEAFKVESLAALKNRFLAMVNKWGVPVIIQEFVRGSEFDVIAIGDGDGGVGGYCTVRKTIVSEKGKGYGAVVVRDNALNEQALSIIKHLSWRGPLELEFVQNSSTREFCLLEINPRFPAWVDFPSTLGHNLPALLVDTLQKGTMTKLPEYPVGKFFLRHFVDLTCSISDMGKLSTLGEWTRPQLPELALAEGI